jgi:GAF domain-containing protein
MARTSSKRRSSALPASGSKRTVSEARRFEELVGELSAAFVRATEDQIDAEIKRWHKQIVLSLGLDRSSISRIDAHSKTFYLIHQWARPGTPEIPQGFNVGSRAPYLTQKLIAGKTVVCSSPDELPVEFDLDLKQMGELVPKSFVTIPMVVGGITVGMVGFSTQNRCRKWPRPVLRRLQLVAEIFSNALQRQRAATANATLRSADSCFARGDYGRAGGVSRARTQPTAGRDSSQRGSDPEHARS